MSLRSRRRACFFVRENSSKLNRRNSYRRALRLEALEPRTLLSATPGEIEWIRQFGATGPASDLARAVDADGNVYVAGFTTGNFPGQTSPGGQDAFLRKYDADGNELWTRQLGVGGGSVEAWGVAVDGSVIYVTGEVHGNTFLRKYDASGTVLWARQGWRAGGYAVAVDGLGGVYVGGGTSIAAAVTDAYVRKYDSSGTELWTHQFGTAGSDVINGLSADASGVYVAGRTDQTLPGQASAGSEDAFVRKYDTSGNVLWTHQFGSVGTDDARAVAVDVTGIYVAGSTQFALPGETGAGGFDAFVRKYDAAGTEVWTRQFGSAGHDHAFAVAVDASRVYVAGDTTAALPGQSSAGSTDAFVRMYEVNGTEQWTRQLGTAGVDQAWGVAADDTAVYLVGTTTGTFPGQTSALGQDAFVVKLASPIQAGTVVTNTNDSGPGSLRAAILFANATPGTDTITFNIPGAGPHSIKPLSQLPNITDPVAVDGYTQPGASANTLATGSNAVLKIELDGSNAPGAHGLVITAGNSTVRGLAINRFLNAGGIVLATNGDNVIEGNYIGPNVSGTGGLGGIFAGIWIGGGANATRIGTNGDGIHDAAERNVISGINIAILIGTGSSAAGSGSHVVAGNYIGTDFTGTVALPTNVGLYVEGSPFNRFGTNGDGLADAAERNVISGNGTGMYLRFAGTHHNVIAGNFVGTDVTGTRALGNGNGLVFDGNVIGMGSPQFNLVGTNANGVHDEAERNLISGNGVGVYLFGTGTKHNVIAGNYIGTDVTGTLALGNGGGVVITDINGGAGLNRIGTNADGVNDAAERNIISGNTGRAVHLHGIGVEQNVVAGNYIGTNATGTGALGNSGTGVEISGGARQNRIGTNGDGLADAAERNLISGNALVGVRIEAGNQTVVAGNYIGTDVTGTAALPNRTVGVEIIGGAQNRIGTNGDGVADTAERNVISGNLANGVSISGPASTQNVVAGNYIGTNATGTAALGNGNIGTGLSSLSDGVLITNGASSNLIGTNADGVADAAERNLISGNRRHGITLDTGGPALLTDNVIAGNYIGTDVNGTRALGNGQRGIALSRFAQRTRIGTNGDGVNDTAERNIISANATFGVVIANIQNMQNVLAGNFVGTDVTGTAALGNGSHGVWVLIGSRDNRIGTNGDGTSDALEANVIAFNRGSGVVIRDNGTINNQVRGNSIHSNVALGIDLGENGVTANDAGDADNGPNQFQNFPLIASSQAGNTTRVTGTLNSRANTSFILDFYASAAADPSGHGEGQRYLGSTIVTTDASSNTSFNALLSAATADGEFVSATATDPAGNTSEFSGAVMAVNPPPTAEAGGPYPVAEGGSIQLDGSGSSDPDQPPETLTYQWDLDNDNVFGETGMNAARGDEVGQKPTFSAAGLDGPSSVTVKLRVTDSGGLSNEDTATIEITNADPVIHHVINNGPVNETSSVNVTVTADDPAGASDPLRYEFDFDNDGKYEVGPQTSNESSHAFDDNGTYRVNVRVTDGDGGAATSFTTVTVDNVAPTAGVTGPTLGVPGQSLTFVLTASDPSAADRTAGFIYTIDWGDGVQVVAASPNNGAGEHVTHAYLLPGTYTVTVTASDKDLGTSGSATHSVTIVQALLQPDTCESGKTQLVVGGTSGNDQIQFNPHGSEGDVLVTMNGLVLGTFRPSGRIVAYGLEGSDEIQVAGRLVNSAWLFGGDGNDRLNGGAGHNVLVGGDGDDLLLGGSGRDLQIGGRGLDQLVANGNEDILIGNYTAYDDNEVALCEIMDEWTRTDQTYEQRVAHLKSGGGLNGPFLLNNATVFDDLASDKLIGAAGRDWFFMSLNDVASGTQEDEEVMLV